MDNKGNMASSYDSIERRPVQIASTPTATPRNTRHILLAAVTALVGGVFLLNLTHLRFGQSSARMRTTTTNKVTRSSYDRAVTTAVKMPSGVNFGSWLSLEDYFFAAGAAVEVATPFNHTVASCLPPLHTGASTGPRWDSETDLLQRLTEQTSLAHALRVFHAYRVAFIDWEDDLATLAALGIQHVRVPLSWCLTDEDPTTIHDQEDNVSLAEKFTCQDPFYPNVRWPAVPRGFIAGFLRACAAHGIGATLDVHTYPGATSIGTFSGLWPLWPRFWTHGDTPGSTTMDVGRGLLHDFIAWCESLAEHDPEAFQGLRAISPMNEPAHLAGLFDPNNKLSFLPELPLDMAQAYLEELAPSSKHFTTVPNGPHLRVLMWLRDAVHAFRHSSLPSLGKELHLNIHESIFSASVLPAHDGDDPTGGHPGATRIIAAWWRGTTSAQERNTWAVLDMHHYHAWEPACQGASDGQANYTCGNVAERKDALARCTSWATHAFRHAVDRECGPRARLASAEFSASTHHLVRHACNDVATLRYSYQEQIRAAEAAHVELFWWSYKMPYGGAFRPAWSFKHFLYLLGVTSRPDESSYGCNDHVALADEPNDDIFAT